VRQNNYPKKPEELKNTNAEKHHEMLLDIFEKILSGTGLGSVPENMFPKFFRSPKKGTWMF